MHPQLGVNVSIHAAQVTYPMRLARILHRTPLILALALPLLSLAVGPKLQRTVLQQYLEQSKMALVAFLSAAFAVITPVLFSVAFVYVTGELCTQLPTCAC